MRLLDRYLLRELMVPFAYCVSGFLIFFISTDLITELDELNKHKLQFHDVLLYYLVKIPEMLILVLPISLLLALLYALTNHARHHELTAIRAAGVSLWRMAAPYFAVGFLLSIVLLVVNELLVPQNIERADKILNRYLEPQTNTVWVDDLGFSNTRRHRKWLIKSYNPVTHQMRQPVVTSTLDTGTDWSISADWASYINGTWTFTNVNEHVLPKGGWATHIRTNSLSIADFDETPEEIEAEIKISKLNNFRQSRRARLSTREILSYRRLHTEDNRKTAMLDTKLHERFASPWTPLIVVLIALPFGAATGRRNVYVGVASSILILFTYYVLSQVGLALGTGGFLWPPLAAWLPNLFFTGLGIALILRVR
jgi:lipopolysaccharide export system permease protein